MQDGTKREPGEWKNGLWRARIKGKFILSPKPQSMKLKNYSTLFKTKIFRLTKRAPTGLPVISFMGIRPMTLKRIGRLKRVHNF